MTAAADAPLCIVCGERPGDPRQRGACSECLKYGSVDLKRYAGGLRVRTADLARSRPPRWAWLHWLVIGYLNLLIGNEGVGKGALMCWLIARLTRGELPGDLNGRPINVGVLGDEDDFDSVWTPRLHAADADLGHVHQIDRPDGGYVNVTEDQDRLADTVREHLLRVLFFDQLLDNLGAGTDDWRQKQVREALQPIRALARQLDVAAVGTLHPNKRGETFRQLVAGAAAFNAISRSSLLIAAHPDDEEVRVIARGKGNLSQPPGALEFRIDNHRFKANGYTFSVPLATGFTDSKLAVDDLLGNDQVREKHTRIGEAVELLETLLPCDGGWHPSKPITEACAERGFDDRMVRNAKNRLRIEHRYTEQFPPETVWRRPPVGVTVRTTVRTSAEAIRTGIEEAPNPLRGGGAAGADGTDHANIDPRRDPHRIEPLPGETYEEWEHRVEREFAVTNTGPEAST